MERIQNYTTPQCEVFELELQGIIADSPNSVPEVPYGGGISLSLTH